MKINKYNYLIVYCILFIIIIQIFSLNIVAEKDAVDIYTIAANLEFYDVFVETCKANLIIKDSGKIYDDIEIILIYEVPKYYDLTNKVTFLEISANKLFKQICLNSKNERSVFFIDGSWLSSEKSYFNFKLVNSKQIECTLFITYQDTDKFHLYHTDNVFPVLQNYDNIYLELKGPFKRWSCQLTKSTTDLKSVIAYYNESRKILKTSFIMPIDKSSAQILILSDDPIKGPYNYARIFSYKK
jgi:hypothetical protein